MDEDTFQRAKRMERTAAEALLEEYYPFVWRVTLALVGRDDIGTGVARYVMKRSLRVLPRWAYAADAQRWYGHHTIISTRRSAKHKAKLATDTLRGPQPQPKYMAFVTSLRELSVQQREALILHDCEGLDLRRTAVAMDCSTEAAGNHLEAARRQLMLIAGPDYERLSEALRRTYQGLTPSEELRLPAVRSMVGRHLWPRRIRRAMTVILALGVLASIYWGLSRLGIVPERFRMVR